MADMEATSTFRPGDDLADNNMTTVWTTPKQAAASVLSGSDVRNSSLGFYHPDSMTIPSDNYTTAITPTTSESGPPAATTLVDAHSALVQNSPVLIRTDMKNPPFRLYANAIRPFDWCQKQRPLITLNGQYALYCKKMRLSRSPPQKFELR